MPDDNDVQLSAGNLLQLAGRFDEAKAKADQILTKDPPNVEAQLLRGSTLVGLKDPVQQELRVRRIESGNENCVVMRSSAVDEMVTVREKERPVPLRVLAVGGNGCRDAAPAGTRFTS